MKIWSQANQKPQNLPHKIPKNSLIYYNFEHKEKAGFFMYK